MKTMTVESVIAELDGGIFEQKLLAALKDTALRVVEHGKKGKVVIELNMSRISESNQITIASKLKTDMPKTKGKVIEEDEVETPMYVGKSGALTAFPENQLDIEDIITRQTQEV